MSSIAVVIIVTVCVGVFVMKIGVIVLVVADHGDIWRYSLVIDAVVTIQSDKLIVEFMKLV